MLQVNVGSQVFTFFLSVALGFLICVFYDIIRALHKTALNGFFEVMLTDILFWFISALLTFCFLIIRCNGIVRGYVLIGIILGFIAVRMLISKFILRFFCFFINIIIGILHFVSSKTDRILVSINKYFKKCVFIVKKVLHKFIKLLYNQLKITVGFHKKEHESSNGGGN